jgi:16S rRNA (cytosine1407-C5)-methyltransferase
MSKSYDKEKLFTKRVADVLGVKAGTVTSVLRNRPVKALRLNRARAKSSREVLAAQLETSGIAARPLPWYPDAFLFPAQQTELVNQLAAVRTGEAFIQNPSSFLPVFALEPAPHDRYLDVCAAPGGKAALFAGLAGNAELWLNDKSAPRMHKLREVLRQLAVKPARLTEFDARHLVTLLGDVGDGFDKMLLDAECSTEAGVNFESRNPLAGWSLEHIEELKHLQTKFAVQAYDLLKPGGIMAYSTCTFAPEENENVISNLLQRRPSAIIQKLQLKSEPTIRTLQAYQGSQYNDEVAKALRIKPSEHMEGFFLCRIVKPTGDDIKDAQLSQTIVDLDRIALAHANERSGQQSNSKSVN